MWRADSLDKTLMLGKSEGRRRRGWQRWDGWMASLNWWTWVWASSGSWWWTGKPGLLQSKGSQRVGHDWETELNWWYKLANMDFKNVKLDPYFEWKWMCSVVSNSLRPHGPYSPWNSLGQNTGLGSLSLLQGIFPTQGSNPGLLQCRQILYQLNHTQNLHSRWTKDQNGNSKM